MSITLSAKLRLLRRGVYMHWCPGCDSRHLFYVGEPNAFGAQWRFNGDINKPTFTGSMRIRTGRWTDPETLEIFHDRTVCHYYITEGKIEYLRDCGHKLAGQVVDMPDFPMGQR